MRIEIVKRIICIDCGSDSELKDCEIITSNGLLLQKVLCLDCLLKREKEYAEK